MGTYELWVRKKIGILKFRLRSAVLPVEASKQKARVEFFYINICCAEFNSESDGEKKIMEAYLKSTQNRENMSKMTGRV